MRMRTTLALGLLLLASGCTAGNRPPPAGAEGPIPTTFAAQVARGQRLFAESCASCHGASGEGTPKAPRVVGLAQGALPLDPRPGQRLRKQQFRTVADVADFTMKAMPLNAPGSLSADEYWDILAF